VLNEVSNGGCVGHGRGVHRGRRAGERLPVGSSTPEVGVLVISVSLFRFCGVTTFASVPVHTSPAPDPLGGSGGVCQRGTPRSNSRWHALPHPSTGPAGRVLVPETQG
jgi:hypothetical protein